jgi:hypothetical protein
MCHKYNEGWNLMEEITTLTKLLKSVALYHPHYDDRLATHLPMGLIALKRLNASDKKLKETFNNSIIGLDHIGNLDEIVAIDNLTDHLGESSKYSNYLKYFMNEIKSHGADFVLTTVLPILIPGLAASAFHALIRLAYAIEENNESEIAIALAFW